MKQLLKLTERKNKGTSRANALLSVSLAAAKAAAKYSELSLFRYIGGTNAHLLPVPMMNIINGGMHADNKLDFQEFMIMPVGRKFCRRIEDGVEVFQHLKTVLKSKSYSTNVGDEGGFAPGSQIQ